MLPHHHRHEEDQYAEQNAVEQYEIDYGGNGAQRHQQQRQQPGEPREERDFSRNHHDGRGRRCRGRGSFVRGITDGFGGNDLGSIMRHLGRLTGGHNRALTNMFEAGGLEGLMRRRRGRGQWRHRFHGIHEDTGRINGAVAGNQIFGLGGRHNNLGDTGKVILDNLITGKCKHRRRVRPFKHPVPEAQEVASKGEAKSLGLEFEAERDRCLKSQQLFEDPEFPASDSSIYHSNPPPGRVEWKRPHDLVSDPQLIMGTQTRFDVQQGQLGDCWLLAAVANLTMRDELFYRVVPPDQSFTENYAGIFHFQFWRYGEWTDVVVDDRLPCINGKLCYMHSSENRTFWSALLEKAYAKLYGSYENLEGGTTAEALEDFTGGLTEYFDLSKTDKETILAMLVRGFQMGSLFACSINANPNIKEAQLSNGLIMGHAYSITALQKVSVRGTEIVLLRIRNPWGNSKEWRGPWSDDSSEWRLISEEQKKQMALDFKGDGEFWMSIDDFCSNMDELEVCNLSAEVMDEIAEITEVEVEGVGKWEEKAQDGAWSTSEGTAGGCLNNPTLYATNPQYASFFSVTQDTVEDDGKCTVIVAVLQKYRREMRTVGKDSLPIGFSVYAVSDNQSGPLDVTFFRTNSPVAKSGVFIDMREVTSRFRVDPGQYVIVPSTFDPNCDGEFLLRIYVNGTMQNTRFR